MAIVSRNNSDSKSAKAKAIYAEMLASEQQFSRKDVIERFMKEALLTKTGAATYYQKLAKKTAGSDVVDEQPVPEQPVQEVSTTTRPRRRSK